MMQTTPFEIKQSLDLLADRLLSIDAASAKAADRLRDLGDAVLGGPSADAWASSNIHTLINPQGISELVRHKGATNKIFGGLEWLRNILVLFPLMFTWFAIFLAVGSYYDLLSENPSAATKPFLYLWEQGFDGRVPEVLRLGAIALADSVLILAVLIITTIVHSRANYTQLQLDRDANDILTDLEHTIALASLSLVSQVAKQPLAFLDHFDSVSKQLLTELAEERARISELANRREKELEDLSKVTDTFRQSAQLIHTASDALITIQATLLNRIESLQNAVNGLNVGVGHFAGTLDSALSKSTAQLGTLTNATQLAGANIKSLDKQFTQISSDLQTALATLEVSVTSAADAATNISTVAQTLAKGQTDFLTELGNERAAHTTLTNNVISANVGLDQALREVKDAGIHLHAIAVDLSQLIQYLPSFPASMRNDIFDMIQQHSSAALTLSSAGSVLNTAAASIDLASQNLSAISTRLGQRVGTTP